MTEITYERSTLEYTNYSKKFSQVNPNFNKQYCNLYVTRLHQMTPLLENRINQKWGDTYPVCKLHKLSEDDHPKVIVIGTLFKDQKLKPSVLKQLAEAHSLIPQPIVTKYTLESDTLHLEDELQRYQLVEGLNSKEVVTGISCALLGADMGKGKFMVEDYCFADLQAQIERPLFEQDVYIVFISGLDLVHPEKTMLALQLFTNWITGVIGNINGIDVSKIAHLIVAGNSTKTTMEKGQSTISMTTRAIEHLDTVQAVKLLDALLLELAQVVQVDVMPGEHDPSNHILPQKPMHHCMFPNSMAYKSLNQVSNPYECQLSGVRILGNSGQPVRDVLRFCDLENPIDALESCLRWGHMAPTAPDTMGCFPFYEQDPFVMEECPHVMFAGNQDQFETRVCSGSEGQEVRLISVPQFSKTCTAVILNLKNLDCVPISFLE